MMENEKFQCTIDAPKEKVWEILWSDVTYPQWTAAFSDGSKAETDWKEGSDVLFLNGENEGMISRIIKRKDNELMVFEHLGMHHKDGTDDLESDSVKEWAGGTEAYELEESDGKTILTVKMDVTEETKEMFTGIWPKAFEKLKELCEA